MIQQLNKRRRSLASFAAVGALASIFAARDFGPVAAASLDDMSLKHTCESARGVVLDAETGNAVDQDDLAKAQEKLYECGQVELGWNVKGFAGGTALYKEHSVSGDGDTIAEIDKLTGPTFGISAGHEIVPFISLEAELRYSSLSGETPASAPKLGVEDGNYSVQRDQVTALTKLSAQLTQNFTAYGALGIQYAKTESELETPDWSTKSTDWSSHGVYGAGIKYDIDLDSEDGQSGLHGGIQFDYTGTFSKQQGDSASVLVFGGYSNEPDRPLYESDPAYSDYQPEDF